MDNDFIPHFAVTGEHSDESLRNVVTKFILAGRDPTLSALNGFSWLVSTRPDAENKMVHVKSGAEPEN